MAKSPAIGVDLGTTYCCVAVYRGEEEVIIVPNHLGKNTTPSYVAYLDDEVTVGDIAKDQAHENPENTIFDVKRLIGRHLNDPFIQRDRKLWSFELAEIDGHLRIKADDRRLLPEEVSTDMLTYLKQTAEDYLGCPISEAVITVPAYFTSHQRYLTKVAATKAGIKALQLVTEPTAAAIAYNLHRRDDSAQNCLIFDLGGGTFDVAVLTIEKNFIQVRAIGGDPRLGGEDFDNAMLDYCIKEFEQLHGIDLAEGKGSDNPGIKFKVSKRLRRIKQQCEKQKCYLSQAKTVIVSLDAVHGELDLTVEFKRSTFEALIQDHLNRCIDVVGSVLLESGIPKEEINDVVLIGGSSRIPRVQEMLQAYFGGKNLYRAINPDEAVASGAAIQAYFAQNKDLAGIGIEEPDFVVPNPSLHSGSVPPETPGESSVTTPSGPGSDTSNPASPFSSGVGMKPSLDGTTSGTGSPSLSRTPSRATLFSRSTSHHSFGRTSTPSSLSTHIGVYMDEEMVKVFDLTEGNLTVMSRPIFEIQPFVAINDNKLRIGFEAAKSCGHESFYRIMDLLTKPNNRICQVTDGRRSDFGILFEEEIIATFLMEIKLRVEKALKVTFITASLTVPFIPTNAQRGRIQIAAILAGLVKTQVNSNITLTALAYGNMRKGKESSDDLGAHTQILAINYGHRFFSAALIRYSASGIKVRSYDSSYLLPPDNRQDFLVNHSIALTNQQPSDVPRIAETYFSILQKACGGVSKNAIQYGFLIRNQESKFIDDLVEVFFDRTIYTFNDLRGPLTGAGVLLSQNYNPTTTPIFDACPGNLQCVLVMGKKENVIFNEANEDIPTAEAEIFTYPIVLDREKGVTVTLKEVFPDRRVSEICSHRISARYSDEPKATHIPLVCELDGDGVYHLFINYQEEPGVVVDFFRTDKLNSDFSNITNRIGNFHKFYKAVTRKRKGISSWIPGVH